MKKGVFAVLIKNARIVTEHAVLENSDLLIKDGRIYQIGQDLPECGETVVQADGRYLLPGLVDILPAAAHSFSPQLL